METFTCVGNWYTVIAFESSKTCTKRVNLYESWGGPAGNWTLALPWESKVILYGLEFPSNVTFFFKNYKVNLKNIS